jgi:glycine cleavage system H protein
MKFPDNIWYTNEHMWTQALEDGLWVAGISDYAQDLLGDVVFVDPPNIGQRIEMAKPCGLVESVKTGSDLHAPLDGEVVEINPDVLDSPECLNDKPYKHWIFKFKANDPAQAAHLLTAEAYKELTGN